MAQKHSKTFKFKVALEALKNQKSVAEICQEYNVANTLVYRWKDWLKAKGETVFEGSEKAQMPSKDFETAKLYEEIGRLKMEIDSKTLTQQEKIYKKLKIAELDASLDALTGGYFSQYLSEKRAVFNFFQAN